jgi:DNA-binding MarR family transcriptional regulator
MPVVAVRGTVIINSLKPKISRDIIADMPYEKVSLHPVVQLADEVARIGGRLQAVFADAHSGSGLSKMETTILMSVAESRFAPTVPQIGRSLGHPRQVIQRAANTLIAAGLLETMPNPHHKRAPLLKPTSTGEQLKKQMSARALKAADTLLEGIDFARCATLARELHELRRDIEASLRSFSK